LSVSVHDSGAAVEIAAVSLVAPDRTELLENGDFSAGLAHWLPTARSHYLPWHIDNLYLELLIEHGVVALAAFLLLCAAALANLIWLTGRGVDRAIPRRFAAGSTLVGSVSSILTDRESHSAVPDAGLTATSPRSATARCRSLTASDESASNPSMDERQQRPD
jgi:hypothetical protein